MPTNRRTFLQFLGLAPAGVAVETDSFFHPGKEAIAAAFRKLADGIESGQILVEEIEHYSTIKLDEIHKHTLHTHFLYLDSEQSV